MKKYLLLISFLWRLGAHGQIFMPDDWPEHEGIWQMHLAYKQEDIRKEIRDEHVREVKISYCSGDTVSHSKMDCFPAEELRYDTIGNLTYRLAKNRAGKTLYHYQANYDKAGKMLSRTWFAPSGRIAKQQTRVYDNQGNLTEMMIYMSSGVSSVKWKDIFEYYPDNYLKNRKAYNENGNLQSDITFYDHMKNGIIKEGMSYDKNGQIMHKYSYYQNGTRKQDIKYQDTVNFDSVPLPSEKHLATSDSLLKERTGYEKDENGNMLTVKENYEFHDIISGTRIRKFDANQNMISMSFRTRKGKVISNYKFVYDNHNHITECDVFRRDTNKMRFRFIYMRNDTGKIKEIYCFKNGNKLKSELKYNYEGY